MENTSYNSNNKKSFYTITKGTALEQHMKLPRIANAMAYTNLPTGKLIQSISTYLVGDGTITSYVDK